MKRGVRGAALIEYALLLLVSLMMTGAVVKVVTKSGKRSNQALAVVSR